MSQSIGVALSNPLDDGNSANSVETAAHGFDRIFGDAEPSEANPFEEKAEPKPSRPARRKPEEDEGEPGPDAATEDDDGQGPDDLADPILDDTAPTGDDTEEDEEGEGEDDESDEEDDDADIYDREFEVVVAGETEKLPLKEIIAGYSRDADYRQKTARLADERREVEDFATEVVTARRTLDATITEWEDRIKAIEPSQEEWDLVERENPALALQMRKQWDAQNALIAKAKADREALTEQEAKDAARQRSQYVREENQKLFGAVPALANPKHAERFRSLIFSYGKKAGYSEAELMQNGVDHRNVLTLYKAARYDEIQAARKGKGGKTRSEPKPAATVASRPRQIGKGPAPGNRRAVRDAENRLARTGSVQDAAVAFSKMLEG